MAFLCLNYSFFFDKVMRDIVTGSLEVKGNISLPFFDPKKLMVFYASIIVFFLTK
jgi:hypothetical protein